MSAPDFVPVGDTADLTFIRASHGGISLVVHFSIGTYKLGLTESDYVALMFGQSQVPCEVQRCLPPRAEAAGLNGLTDAQTAATASVAGLKNPTVPPEGIALSERPNTPETRAEDAQAEAEHAAEMAEWDDIIQHGWSEKEGIITSIRPSREESDVLRDLAAKQDLSPHQVFRQALRVYQDRVEQNRDKAPPPTDTWQEMPPSEDVLRKHTHTYVEAASSVSSLWHRILPLHEVVTIKARAMVDIRWRWVDMQRERWQPVLQGAVPVWVKKFPDELVDFVEASGVQRNRQRAGSVPWDAVHIGRPVLWRSHK